MMSGATRPRTTRRPALAAAIALLVVILIVFILGTTDWSPAAAADQMTVESAIGATFTRLDPATGRSLGDGTNPNDLIVTSVATDGTAGRAGIRAGDIIERIDGRRASDFAAAAAAVKRGRSPLTLVVLRHREHIIVQLPIRPAPDTH